MPTERARVTLADAAHLAQVPARTLSRWAACERLTVVVRGGLRWFDLEEIRELKGRRGRGGRLPRSVAMAYPAGQDR